MTQYQVWINDATGPRIVYESQFLDSVEAYLEMSRSQGWSSEYVTKTESENPNEYIKVDV